MSAHKHIFKSLWKDQEIPQVLLTRFIFQTLEDDDHDNGSKTAYIDAFNPARKVSFSEFKQLSYQVAQGLQKAGLKLNDVVLIYSPNTIEYPAIIFGILLAGGVASPANPTYTLQELTHQTKDSMAQFMITLSPFSEVASQACTAAKIPLERLVVLGDAVPPGTTSWKQLISNDGNSVAEVLQHPNDVAVIPYSSGTTGLPKGVMLTHYNLVANIIQVRGVNGTSITAADSYVGVLPFFHIYGLVVTMFLGLYLGNTVAVMPKFDLELFLKAVQTQKLTVLQLVPPIIVALAKHPIVSKFDLSSVRTIMSGAAPLGAETCKALIARLPKIVLRQGYGMTELAPVSHFQTQEGVVFGSIGVLLCNQEAMIVNPETLESLPQGSSGELWIRGPNVMKGYWRRPDATDSTIVQGGWLRTGDIAMITPDGHYWIVDRLKELIKYKGFQVPPAELEEMLLTHPEISDCAVLGVPDEEAGELPKAFVVLKPSAVGKISSQDIQKYAASKLAPHKHLRGGVVFMDTIPKSASGKILRRVLKIQDEQLRKKQESDSKKAKL